MFISVYTKVKAHPKSKEEKTYNAKLTGSDIIPDIATIKDHDDLIKIVTNYAYSPSLFFGGRLKANFKSADFIAIDIDEGMSIDEAFNICNDNNITSLCLPSPSYSLEQERFRIIFPLAKTIFRQDVFDATWEYLKKLFPKLDKNCCDSSRFFFACSMQHDVGFFIEGDLLVPSIILKKEIKSIVNKIPAKTEVGDNIRSIVKYLYGEDKELINEDVSFFLENAHTGLSGSWWCSLNLFVFTLSLQNVDYDVICKVVEELAPEVLDDRDIKCIDIAYKDGQEKRVDL